MSGKLIDSAKPVRRSEGVKNALRYMRAGGRAIRLARCGKSGDGLNARSPVGFFRPTYRIFSQWALVANDAIMHALLPGRRRPSPFPFRRPQ